jgi:hypothetical protein
MNDAMQERMLLSWLKYDDGNDVVDPDFYKGFEAAYEIIMPLLEVAAEHVYATAGAEHMLDGFRPRERPIDELVKRLKHITSGDRNENV